jgi:hypothetical protein
MVVIFYEVKKVYTLYMVLFYFYYVVQKSDSYPNRPFVKKATPIQTGHSSKKRLIQPRHCMSRIYRDHRQRSQCIKRT